MTITLNIALTYPFIIEEQIKMISLLIEQLVCKDIQKGVDISRSPCVLPVVRRCRTTTIG